MKRYGHLLRCREHYPISFVFLIIQPQYKNVPELFYRNQVEFCSCLLKGCFLLIRYHKSFGRDGMSEQAMCSIQPAQESTHRDWQGHREAAPSRWYLLVSMRFTEPPRPGDCER